MSHRFALLILAVCLTACGSSSASSSQATPTSASALGRVVTVPPMTVQPAKGGKSGKGQAVRPPSGKLATPKPLPMVTPTPFPPSAYTAVLEGRVTDSKTGSPLADVLVVVGTSGARRALTGPRGRYRIAFPARAMVPVNVTRPGYVGQLQMGALKQHETFILNFKLRPAVKGRPAAPPPPGIFGHP